MSAQFILEYGGAPVRLGSAGATLCQEWEADRFIAEPDAWLAAHRAGLAPGHCRVVDLYARNGRNGRNQGTNQPEQTCQ